VADRDLLENAALALGVFQAGKPVLVDFGNAGQGSDVVCIGGYYVFQFGDVVGLGGGLGLGGELPITCIMSTVRMSQKDGLSPLIETEALGRKLVCPTAETRGLRSVRCYRYGNCPCLRRCHREGPERFGGSLTGRARCALERSAD
jgi:hypothetical protein